MRPPIPQARDTVGIVEHVFEHGSVEYPIEAVPLPFDDWRAGLRACARAADRRVGVRRLFDLGVVIVFDPDRRSDPARMRRVVEAIAAQTYPSHEEIQVHDGSPKLRLVRTDETRPSRPKPE